MGSTQLEINNIVASSGNFTSSLEVNGTGVSVSGHTHTASAISDSTTAGRALLTGADTAAQRTSLGLGSIATLSSGTYALLSHTHTSSDISDFNSSVSGLIPIKDLTAGTNIQITPTTGNYTISVTGAIGGGATITNYADNRILTSDGTSSGIVGESNLTFDGSLLTSPSGNFTNNLQVGSTSLTSNDVLNIINSNNLYLWSNFR